MPAPNYIIRDTVRYVHCEEEYRRRRTFSRAFRNLKANLWLFGMLVAFSAGIGFFAVTVSPTPESGHGAQGILDQFDTSSLRQTYNSLNDKEKAELKRLVGSIAK